MSATRHATGLRSRAFAELLTSCGASFQYNGAMGMKVYRAGRIPGRNGERKRRGGILRPLLLILLVLFVLLLGYLIVPFGGQRVVLLGSDARAGEASRSDTIV